jgi:hypothetical protein
MNKINIWTHHIGHIPAVVCCVLILVAANIPLLLVWMRAKPLQIAAILVDFNDYCPTMNNYASHHLLNV